VTPVLPASLKPSTAVSPPGQTIKVW